MNGLNVNAVKIQDQNFNFSNKPTKLTKNELKSIQTNHSKLNLNSDLGSLGIPMPAAAPIGSNRGPQPRFVPSGNFTRADSLNSKGDKLSELTDQTNILGAARGQ